MNETKGGVPFFFSFLTFSALSERWVRGQPRSGNRRKAEARTDYPSLRHRWRDLPRVREERANSLPRPQPVPGTEGIQIAPAQATDSTGHCQPYSRSNGAHETPHTKGIKIPDKKQKKRDL